MANNFKLPCCSQSNSSRFVAFLNAIIIVLAGLHWKYSQVMGKYIAEVNNPYYGLQSSYYQANNLYYPLIYYFYVVALLQIVTSIFVILFGCLGICKNTRCRWSLLMAILLVLNFGCNFMIAASSAINWSYYSQLYKPFLDVFDYNIDVYLKGLIFPIRDLYLYTKIEAVITTTVILPLIFITIVALLNNSLKEDLPHPINDTSITSSSTFEQEKEDEYDHIAKRQGQ